jgi:hypothetical protein
MKLSLIIVPFAVLALAGCSAGDTSSGEEATTTSDQRLLDFVNYPDTSEQLLDVTVKLDVRAAKNIVGARAGVDGVYPSSDDVPFASVAQLDAIGYVGSAALAKLEAYAAAHPAPSSETVEGVTFSGWQSVAVVWGVNHSTSSQLDALLDARAAKALAAGAPFASVSKMGPVAYVGPSALAALRDHAAAWWTASKGFTLDEATRATEAEMLKESLSEDEGFIEDVIQPLAGNNGEGVTIVTALMGEIDVLTKPLVGNVYADQDTAIAAVASAAPMKQLTKSGQWAYLESIGVKPPTQMACVAAYDTAIIPKLGSLEFMSESDRPFDVQTFAGQGTTAPTAASVMALVNAPSGSTALLRNVSDFYGDLESDDVAATAVETEFGTLTDVVYVAVFAPPDSENTALVDVYLVGRTSCGDLVALHSISVET